MTEEQLIQEYSDAVYPKIAKALIGETKAMFIEKAYEWFKHSLFKRFGINGWEDEFKNFKQAMEEQI